MGAESANFAVFRNGTLYRCGGSELNSSLETTDILLLQRGDVALQFTKDELDQIGDDDLLVCTDVDDVTYTVTGAQFKALFTITPDPEGLERCLTIARDEYLDCRLKCETAYCQSICTSNYEAAKVICYIDNGFPVP